jgi:RNA polymerase sigma factor (sigma-70 family)
MFGARNLTGQGEPSGLSTVSGEGKQARLAPDADARRKRAAVETYARHEAALRRTARRYSICGDDADEALQRALEILLRKAPSDDPRELIRWTQTVVKHEALAVRRERERILSGPAAKAGAEREDWVALIPADSDGPAERAERREEVARSREALQSLKPQELRALTLLAEGYSYAEIGEITGWTRTKINRCLAEGRERFRTTIGRSEDGSLCAEMRPRLSALCDGEIAAEEEASLREHLRACSSCRATLRAYRAAPKAAAALAPAIPLHRSLLERVHDSLATLAERLGGAGGGEGTLPQVAAGSGGGAAGLTALAKTVALCVGTAGGVAACVATGLVPGPLGIGADQHARPAIETRQTESLRGDVEADLVPDYEAAPKPVALPDPEPTAADHPVAQEQTPTSISSSAEREAGAVEYVPPPPPEPVVQPPPTPSTGGGDPAGEFGP